jgi:circadian clock protein KaiC
MKKKVTKKVKNFEETKKKKVKEVRKSNIKESVKKRKIIKVDPNIRVSTGVKGLDKLSEGGFENNSTTVVVGGSGSGKTILAAQFLMEGVKKNERVLYITFEEKKDEFYRHMKRLGMDFAPAEKKGNFIFLQYYPEKVKLMLEEGGGDIESIVLKNKIKRIVIDSITSFTLLFNEELEKRQSLLGLFDILRRWSCTTVLTLEENPLAHKESSEGSPVEFEADGIILLYFVRVNKERLRYFEILKMRGAKHSKKIYPFDIGKGGLTISKKPEKINLNNN